MSELSAEYIEKRYIEIMEKIDGGRIYGLLLRTWPTTFQQRALIVAAYYLGQTEAYSHAANRIVLEK